MQLFRPADGPAWLPDFARSVLNLFRSRLDRPLLLWSAATADLSSDARMGAGEGALAWDATLGAPSFFDGAAWGRMLSLTFGDAHYVAKAGGTMTGMLAVAMSGVDPIIDSVDTDSPGSGSGGRIRLRLASKPTAAGQRIGVLHFGAVDSAAAVQQSAAILAFAGADWGTLASEESYLTVEVTAAGSTARSEVLRLTGALATFAVPAKLPNFTVAGVPSAATLGAGTTIYVSNESGGATVAFSDGANWRRVTDRAVIS